MMRRLRNVLAPLVVFLPWRAKRVVLQLVWGYDLHETARIGWSYVFPAHLTMEEHARIGHFNVAMNLDQMRCGAHSIIARSNWITGHPVNGPFFQDRPDRRPDLDLGAYAAIVKHHTIDCSDRVSIGDFTVVGGYRSQILTHGIDLASGEQDCQPVSLGSYGLIGTGVKVLAGAQLPDYCALGAGAVLRHAYEQSYMLYAGLPARPVRELARDAGFFTRTG